MAYWRFNDTTEARFPSSEFIRATQNEIWNLVMWLARREKVGSIPTFYHSSREQIRQVETSLSAGLFTRKYGTLASGGQKLASVYMR